MKKQKKLVDTKSFICYSCLVIVKQTNDCATAQQIAPSQLHIYLYILE